MLSYTKFSVKNYDLILSNLTNFNVFFSFASTKAVSSYFTCHHSGKNERNYCMEVPFC